MGDKWHSNNGHGEGERADSQDGKLVGGPERNILAGEKGVVVAVVNWT